MALLMKSFEITPDMPIADAIEVAYATRWVHHREPLNARNRAMHAFRECLEHGLGYPSKGIETLICRVPLREITRAVVKTTKVGYWQAHSGLSAGSINHRLVVLSACGVDISGLLINYKDDLKWWLKPDEEEALVEWLRATRRGDIADYITWTTNTGLRVEETLRVTRGHFSTLTLKVGGEERPLVELTVPGTKTVRAQAAIPLNSEAAAVFHRRIGASKANAPLFPFPYTALAFHWSSCKAFLGYPPSMPGVTLRALRRSFAKKATMRSMPTEVLRRYMRHSNIKTTLGYLELVGGFTSEETAQWL